MNTIMWLQIEILEPLCEPLYWIPDGLLGWLARFGPVTAVILIAVISGLGVNLFQKFFSRQKLLGQCKADLDKLKKLMDEAKKAGDDDKFARLMNVSGRISGKYMWGSLKPSIWTIPPVIFVIVWAGARFAAKPIPPGRPTKVTAYFEDDAKGYATAIPGPGLKLTSAPISPIELRKETEEEEDKRKRLAEKQWAGTWWKPWTWARKADDEQKRKWREESTPPLLGQEAQWEFEALEPGERTLTIIYQTADGREEAEVPVPVVAGNGKAPELYTNFLFDSPTHDRLQCVLLGEIDLENPDKSVDSMPPAWWNVWFQWMGLYFVVVLACAIGFRFALKVN